MWIRQIVSSYWHNNTVIGSRPSFPNIMTHINYINDLKQTKMIVNHDEALIQTERQKMSQNADRQCIERKS